jgi:hypothetical protein
MSRAEKVRARRLRDMDTRVSTAADVVTRPPAYQPAIQSRAKDTLLPIMQKPRQRTRRRVFFRLPGGKEFRLPAMPIFNPGWRVVSAAIFIVSAFFIYTFLTSPFFNVSKVSLHGGDRITSEEMEIALAVTGKNVLTLSPQSLENIVKNTYPVVEKARVSIGFPASISVRITERVPVLIWEQDGNLRWISADGVAFEPKGEAEGLTTIFANGNPPSGGYNLSLVKQESSKPLASLLVPTNLVASQLVDAAPTPKFIDPALIPAIQGMAAQAPAGVSLIYDPTFGIGWADPNGWQVFFGVTPAQMPEKLAAYAVIVDELSKRGVHPLLISMENLYAPYIRME